MIKNLSWLLCGHVSQIRVTQVVQKTSSQILKYSQNGNAPIIW